MPKLCLWAYAMTLLFISSGSHLALQGTDCVCNSLRGGIVGAEGASEGSMVWMWGGTVRPHNISKREKRTL